MATVSSEIRETPYGRALLIERYDRIVWERRVIRIHQEDFCQLTGREAPLYDLVSTRAYPGIARELAMGIGARFDPGQVGAAELEAEALAIGIRPAYLIKKGRMMAERLPEVSAAVYREWSGK
jgi:hypothetical protein